MATTSEIFAANLGVAVAHGGPEFEPAEYVAGLANPTENFFNIVGWLVKHGYTDEQIVAVTGGNILRALGEIW